MSDGEKNRARRHHILPQSYLCRFAVDEKVNVLDFVQRRQYKTGIRNAACIEDFYTVETTDRPEDDCVEQKFLAAIEGVPGPIIDAIVADLSVPQGTDWEVLANYVALMYVRGPWFRQIVQDVYNTLANKTAEYLHSDSQIWQDAMSVVEGETGKKINIEYDDALEIYRNSDIAVSIPRTFSVKQMMLRANNMVSVFQAMTPNLLYVPVWVNAEFVTSDRPIVAISRTSNPPPDWKWLGNPQADLFFRLSSRKCLVLNYNPKSQILMASRKQVAPVNHVLALNCTRIVVSQDSGFVWLREQGTVSTSTEELIEFVHATPESGPVSGDGWDALRGR